MARSTTAAMAVFLAVALVHSPGILGAQTPVPQPFPGSKTPPPAPPSPPPQTVRPAPAAPVTPPPTTDSAEPSLAGVPLYPQAQFLDSYDAGQGQRYYLYGTTASFEEVAMHFRTTLMSGGRQLFRTPAIQQFDLGRFDDQRMAYPPSVVVKDYAASAGGYLFVRGTTEQRFRTIIQIVPPTPAPAAR
jgi:hypothetical protein